jgi:hypothetical protein
MRRIALLGLFLLLTGCGTDFGHFLGDTHTFRANPNMPPGDSENLRRVAGEDATQPVLTPEPGNIWPPPAGPMPTLMDLEKTSPPGTPGSTPGSTTGATTPPAVGYGGSPPPVPSGGVGAEAPLPMPKASQMPTVRPSTTAPPSYQTPAGTAVTTGSGPGYSTTTNPGGGGNSIVVPNGNGTSTIIHADGTVETVPTPK